MKTNPGVATLPHPDPNEDPPLEIDPRSFHVFEAEGGFFLFDRATATLSELNESAWQLLHLISRGVSIHAAVAQHSVALGLDDESPLWESLSGLQAAGFFKYEPVDREAQEIYIQQLWDHHPRRIQLLIAQGCNLGCRYCYAWRNGSNQLNTLMPFEVAKAAVDHLVAKSGDRTSLQVTFFGGEPLLNWEVLTKVVEYCDLIAPGLGKSFDFEVITNATLLTRERVHYLAERKFLLMISIDGWKEMHDYNRPNLGLGSNYDEIVENALYADKYYRGHGLWPVKVRANLTHRFHDGSRVTRYLRDLGFERVAVAPIEALPHADPSPSAMTEDDCDEYDRLCIEHHRDMLSRLRAGMELSEEENVEINGHAMDKMASPLKGIICGVGRNTQCVDVRGNIYPCHRYEGMKAFIIGDVYNGLDEERTLRYYRAVNGNATNRCHSCWIRDYCAGGCPWLLSTSSGFIVDPTERECDRRRNGFQHFLYMRGELRKLRPELFSNSRVDLENWSFDKEAKNVVASACGGGCSSCGN